MQSADNTPNTKSISLPAENFHSTRLRNTSTKLETVDVYNSALEAKKHFSSNAVCMKKQQTQADEAKF